MIKRSAVAQWLLSIAGLFLLTCTGQQSPFQLQDATVNVIMANSNGHRDADTVTDTVENHVLIGMVGYLPTYISLVKVVIGTAADTDTTLTYLKATAWADTQWIRIAFHSIGTRTVTIHVALGATEKIVTATIMVVGRPVVISNQSTSFSVDPTGAALFFVTPRDTGKFSFQWVKDGSRITGANSDTLVIDTVLAANAGVYTCVVKDQWGDSAVSTPAVLTINASTNHKPQLSVTGVRNIVSAQACSLSLSTTDADSGQTFVYAMPRAPQGATLTANIFKWTPPAAFLGTDTVVFSVMDNGKPPMSDTQTVYITVSSQITAPVKVSGIKVVSKVNEYFVLSWTKVGNADSYNVFRSADTINFQKIGSTSDSLYGDSMKTGNYYYYVVAVNTAGSSPASAIVYSGSISIPPVIMVLADTSVSQGKTLSFIVQTIASAQDSITFSATDMSGAKLPDSAAFNPKTGVFTWTPTSSELGFYSIVFIATDGNMVVKDTVKITVIKTDRPPVVQPQSVNAGRNQAITIALVATDPDGDAITQWQLTQKPDNGTATLADSTKGSIVYTPNSGFIGVDTFEVKAYDGTLWSVASANVTITVDSNKVAPKIQTQPRQDTTVNPGGFATFTVAINNAFPSPIFRWFHGTKPSGSIKDSSTNPLYQLIGVVNADSGDYYTVVSNSSGSDTSAYAHIAVNVAPVLQNRFPAKDTVAQGGNLALAVTLNPNVSPAATYQWMKNGTLTSVIVNSYTINPAAYSDSAVYKVTVSNSAGQDTESVTVLVKDTTTPSIDFHGASDTTIAIGSVWTDPATASDARDGNLTARISRSQTVVTTGPAKCTITYNVSDNWGNAAPPKSRTVRVQGWMTVGSDFAATDFNTVMTANGDLYIAYADASSNLKVNMAKKGATTWQVLTPIATTGVSSVSMTLDATGTIPYIGSGQFMQRYRNGSWEIVTDPSCNVGATPFSNSLFYNPVDNSVEFLGKDYGGVHVYKLDSLQQCWTIQSLFMNSSTYFVDLALMAATKKGSIFNAWQRSDNSIIVSAYDPASSSWNDIGYSTLLSNIGTTLFSLALIDSTPLILALDHNGYPSVWKNISGLTWQNIGAVKTGSVYSSDMTYSTLDATLYAGYVDGAASGTLKSYSSANGWQGFPAFVNGTLPVSGAATTNAKLMVQGGNNAYYASYLKANGNVSTLMYLVIP